MQIAYVPVVAKPGTPYARRVGVALAAMREYLGMTQTALADRAGTSVSTVSRYEGGENPKAETLLALARALGVPQEFLLEPFSTREAVILRLAEWRSKQLADDAEGE
jgi:transcriptional regulator with XRE-family HTH domain